MKSTLEQEVGASIHGIQELSSFRSSWVFLGIIVFSLLHPWCVCVLAEDKVMTLRVKHRDGELLFTPSHETRKEGTEWLKALKKVSPKTFLNRRALLFACNVQGGVGVPDN